MFWPSPLGPGVTAVNARLERTAERCAPSPPCPCPRLRPHSHPRSGAALPPSMQLLPLKLLRPRGCARGGLHCSSEFDVVTVAWVMMAGSE